MAVPNQMSHPPQLIQEERDKLREKVIGQVRAVLLPEKHGMLLDSLNQEYKDIIGENIPWRKLGYSTFDDFVKKNRQLFRIDIKGDGSVWVHAVPTEETQHIRNMVSMQKYKKRASTKPKPARRPLNTQRWSPPTPTMPIVGFNSTQAQSGRQPGNNKSHISNSISHMAGNRISGVQYNRRFPQSGGSGRFSGGGHSSSSPIGKAEYPRPFPGQAQKLRVPTMGYSTNQNNQHNVRASKQMPGMVQHGNSNRRNINSMSNNANMNMNSMTNKQNQPSNRLTNGNHTVVKSFPANYNVNNVSRNNNNVSHNSKTNYEQYKPLLQEYFDKNNLGELEYKTASLESKVSGPSGNQNGKNFKTSKSMKRYISTVKVNEKNYQTFPQDFATSEAAEEAAAKLACIQLNVSKATLLEESGSNDKNDKGAIHNIKNLSSIENASNSTSRSDDTDFGEWIPPTNDKKENALTGLNAVKEIDMIKYIDRIIQLVGARSNGVWSTQIDIEYSQIFHDTLPDKWPDEIERMEYGQKRLRVDRPIPGRCIILPNLEFNVAVTSSDLPIGNQNKLNPDKASNSISKDIIQENLHVTTIKPLSSVKTPLSSISTTLPPPKKDLSNLYNIPPPLITSAANSTLKAAHGGNAKVQQKPPSLRMPDEELWDVYVTHVHSTMNVCLRLLGDGYSARFDDLVTNMELHYFNADAMPSVFSPTVGKLYAAKVDGEWHRVEVTNVRGVDISCYFIDHGDEEELKVADLKELQDEFLTLAPQAKHVRMAGLEDFRDSTSAIANLTSMALGRSLVGNVHANDNDGVSLVLWDTSGENDDEDININETLIEKMKNQNLIDDTPSVHSSMPSLEQSPNGKVNGINETNQSDLKIIDVQPARNMVGISHQKEIQTEVKELMEIDLSSLKPLTRAVLPDADDFFDVTITLAGSPSNFTVQPYYEGRALETLQIEMNKFYSNTENHYNKGPLTSSHLAKDFFFAGRHDDGQWYRVKINSMLDEYSAAVKLVDYGDYSMMQLDSMQPLWPEYRVLPMQAISASLAGIIATHGDWTPDDAVWFAQRVVNKQFVSKIKDVIWDMNDHDACGNGFKLSLSLFDTSNPSKDVVVEKLLVDAGKAVYLCV